MPTARPTSPIRRTPARFAQDLLAYDALTVCSDEDRALVTHPRIESIANGASISSDGYLASEGQRVLFVGPFRYRPNHDGILAFLRTAWPSIRRALPGATLTILGGDEHRADVESEAAFSLPGVEVLGHRDDVPRLLRDCALTINPLTGIRGSAVKLVESLAAGRVCVSTADGARGFGSAAPPGLVVVPNATAMAEPIIALLAQGGRRRELEVPDAATLAQFAWPHAVARQRSLYSALLSDGAHPAETP